MRISFFTDHAALNGREIMESVARHASETDRVLFNEPAADAAVIWSVLWDGRMKANREVWSNFRSAGKPVLICEVGGLKRNETWRLSINGINLDAKFPVPGELDPDRPAKLGLELKPWNTSGQYYLVCGQHGKSEQWVNMPPVREYMYRTISEIRSYDPDTPVVARCHPRYPVRLDRDWCMAHNVVQENPVRYEQTYDEFDFDRVLMNAKCVISYSSNPGIDAVVNGVPAIVGENHIAKPVAGTQIKDILDPPTPDREQWFTWLSHLEYTTEEIHQGLYWPRLRKLLQVHAFG